jgi:hypothetical protein
MTMCDSEATHFFEYKVRATCFLQFYIDSSTDEHKHLVIGCVFWMEGIRKLIEGFIFVTTAMNAKSAQPADKQEKTVFWRYLAELLRSCECSVEKQPGEYLDSRLTSVIHGVPMRDPDATKNFVKNDTREFIPIRTFQTLMAVYNGCLEKNKNAFLRMRDNFSDAACSNFRSVSVLPVHIHQTFIIYGTTGYFI